MMHTSHRRRHSVGRFWLAVLFPLFRYSASRDAYVLRALGSRVGPVFRQTRPKPVKQTSDHIPV